MCREKKTHLQQHTHTYKKKLPLAHMTQLSHHIFTHITRAARIEFVVNRIAWNIYIYRLSQSASERERDSDQSINMCWFEHVCVCVFLKH